MQESVSGTFWVNDGAAAFQPHITWSPLFITASGGSYLFMATHVDFADVSFDKNRPDGPWFCAAPDLGASASGYLIPRA